MSVTLRPLDSSDREWLDGWLPGVANSVGYELPDGDGPCDAFLARVAREHGLDVDVIERDGHAEGMIVVTKVRRSRSAAIIEIVAAPPAASRRGIGMAAAALIEERARSQGIRTLYAPAPAVHGIAMYFWIRLGYRPLLRDAWPCVREGIAWLRRDL